MTTPSLPDTEPSFTATVHEGVASLPAAEWDVMAGAEQPFLSHAFLSAMERSGSVGEGTGWRAMPITIHRDGALAAALPAYLKTHSQGEYVFDHAWADAWHRAGGEYYPKLQIAVPFTPVPGTRVLGDAALAPALLRAAEVLVEDNGLSSAHATFVAPEQIPLFEAAGWLIRQDQQFHWQNLGYGSFDDFLAELSSRKRKAIRKERAAAQAAVTIKALSGDDIRPEHWDAFWYFYQDTGARKWGTPYLTRAAFDLLGRAMADRILLVLAEEDGAPVAGALNFIGPDRLYGRYWGARKDIPCLHFELCYYQAIDAAIARGLAVVEAGAQGSHKLARGYVPTPTYSAHYIANPGFRSAINDYLQRERAAVAQEMEFLGEMTPFRKG